MHGGIMPPGLRFRHVAAVDLQFTRQLFLRQAGLQARRSRTVRPMVLRTDLLSVAEA